MNLDTLPVPVGSIEFHLRIVGVLLLALASLNLLLPGRFGWVAQLTRVELLTRQVFWVHLLFIVLVLVMFGTLCVGAPHLLLEPAPLPRLMLGGLTLFWGLRVLVQVLVYEPRLWIGKRAETLVHVGATCTMTYFAGVFLIALFVNGGGA